MNQTYPSPDAYDPTESDLEDYRRMREAEAQATALQFRSHSYIVDLRETTDQMRERGLSRAAQHLEGRGFYALLFLSKRRSSREYLGYANRDGDLVSVERMP